MKFIIVISFLFLVCLSQYNKPYFCRASYPQSNMTLKNQLQDDTTLQNLCELLSGKWALVGHTIEGIFIYPDTISGDFRINKDGRYYREDYQLLTDSGFIYLQFDVENQKISKIERKSTIYVLQIDLDSCKGIWYPISEYDTISGRYPINWHRMEFATVVKREGKILVHLVNGGANGESVVKIDYVSSSKLIVADEDGYQTVYRRFK